MRVRFGWLLALLWIAAPAARAFEGPVSFNLSTSRTFAPGEKPKIHLYSHNVDALEFRIYRVNDSVKFIENLRELHSFGSEASLLDKEQIDERTWIEKFHDWKAALWDGIHDFFRLQFSHDARRSLRDSQAKLSRRSRIVSETEFAQIPILNQGQLVARWRQLVPATYISDSNDLGAPKLGAGLYLLEATDGRYKAYTLLIVTQMALVTRTTGGSVLAYVVDRTTGAPIPGVKVDSGFGQALKASATTGADGVAQLAVPADKSSPDNFWVVAGKGQEVAVATPQSYALSSSDGGKYTGYVFTERPVYRPTHTVHWKAILRERSGNSLILPKAASVHVTISDEADKNLFDKQMPLSPLGEVSGDFDLPRDAALGYYILRVGTDRENSLMGEFHVEDYRKPEYRVQVTPAQKRVVQGATMTVTLDSRYFFGEPVANAKVKYRVYHETHYWWDEDEEDSSAMGPGDDTGENDYAGDEESEQTGKLDADGKLTIQVPTRVESQGQFHPDLDYTVEAGVTDSANREITGRGRFLATYGTFRIHVEPVSYAIHAGDPAKFHVTAVDYDEKPVSTRVHVQLIFRHYANGKSETTPGPAIDVTTDAAGQATGSLTVGNPPYSSAELEATADAVQSGSVQSGSVPPGARNPSDSNYIWIMGANQIGWDNSTETTQIVADKKTYAPGDTAHLSIVSEATGFYALVVVQGNTLQTRQVVHSDGKTIGFDLPITAESQPNVTVEALFLKGNTLYQATRVLKVPPAQQQLQIDIHPEKDQFQPQQTVSYDIFARDSAGKPVPAELSFGVVDEAIYSIHPDRLDDMVASFYPQRYVESQIDTSLNYYFSGEAGERSPLLAMRQARYRPQLAQVKPGNEAKPRVRKAFPDTAFWAPSIHTDASGHARVSFAFPDSLTTWRTTVRAVTADTKAGSAFNRVLVRKNVLVRMGTPRFLRKDDQITLPVIVHNYLDTSKQATIALKVEGLETVAGSQQTVSIAAKGEATLLWRLRAAQVGTAKLTASAVTDAESDALELSFPVEPAGVARTATQSGVLAQAAAQATASIAFPANTDAAAHSLHIEISPSIAGSLFPALDYLTSYPYGCTEQTMSSYLPNVIVAETLKRLHGNSQVDPAELKARMNAGLERLKDYQHEDGGWGWWKEDQSRVYMTAYVVGGIGLGAQTSPLTGDQRVMLSNGQSYLHSELEKHPRMRPELRAAVVYALAQSDGAILTTDSPQVRAALDDQWDRRNDLDPEALAMTGLAMMQRNDPRAAQIAALLASKAVRQGELVSWHGSYIPMIDLDSSNDAEATAYAVRLLSKVDPNNPLLPGAAQWLMLARNGDGWWNSTEQTAMVLFGLVDYLAASHELDSDFTVDVLVNGRSPSGSVAQRHFTPADAASGATLSIDVDSAQLQSANSVQIVRRGGSGRIYWSVQGKFYSTEKQDIQSETMNLNLTRDYFKLAPTQKDGKIVYALQPVGDTVQVGDVLAVHETIGGTPMRYLLLEDPIPAGAEFLPNEDSYPIDHRPGGWYNWFTRREFHDDHAAFFAGDFTGRQEIFYLIRIVNPGDFAVSPARVAPMYRDGVQATSDSFRLRIPAPAPEGGRPQ